MAIAVGTVAASPQAVASVPIPQTSFDERWAAWQARGVAHERAFRRKVTVASPLLLVIAVVVIYLLLGR